MPNCGRPMTSWDNSKHWQTHEPLTRQQYYEEWRTWQVSDHMPLWLELKIDFSDDYLQSIKNWKASLSE